MNTDLESGVLAVIEVTQEKSKYKNEDGNPIYYDWMDSDKSLWLCDGDLMRLMGRSTGDLVGETIRLTVRPTPANNGGLELHIERHSEQIVWGDQYFLKDEDETNIDYHVLIDDEWTDAYANVTETLNQVAPDLYEVFVQVEVI